MPKHEAEKKEADMEKKEAVADDAGDAGHDDAAQDKELIKKMLKKHLDEEPSDEVMKHAEEAYAVARKAGMKAEEAGDLVGHAMKMAKLMHAYQAEKGEESEPNKAPPSDKDADADASGDVAKKAEDDKKDDDADDKKKESAKDSDVVLKLKGELAAIRESVKKRELADHIDAKLAATGLSRAVTKTVRESLNACRSEAEVDSKITLFLEGFKLGGEAGDLDWIVGAEKTESAQTGVSYADCAE